MKKFNKFFKIYLFCRISNIKIVYLIILSLFIHSIQYILAINYKNIINLVKVPQVSLVLSETFNSLIYLSLSIFMFYIFSYIFNIEKIKSGETIRKSLQEKLIKKLNLIKYSEFNKIELGAWQTYLEDDISELSGFNNNVILEIFAGSVQFGLAIFYGIKNSIVLTSAIILLTFVSIILPSMLSKFIEVTQREKIEKIENLNSGILNFYKNLIIIKTYGADSFVINKLKKIYNDYAVSSINFKKAEGLIYSVSISSGFVIGSIWMIYGIYLVSIDKITLGAFMGFLTLHDCFSWPFYNLSYIFSAYNKCKVSNHRIQNFLDLDNEFGVVKNINSEAKNILVGKNLFYSFNDKILNFNNFSINYGDKIEIFGESGSGKTTLVGLLSGLYDINYNNTEMYVIFNNKIILGNEIRKYISLAYSQPFLFSDTIYNNIAYGKDSDVTIDDVVNVCKKANIHDFIVNLDNGYDTKIGFGYDVKLSTGEKQRISLARAFLKEADIYFFDEVTSSLDVETERTILETIEKDIETFVMISHNNQNKSICNKKIYIS